MTFAQPEPSYMKFQDFINREVIIEGGPTEMVKYASGEAERMTVTVWTVTNGVLEPHPGIWTSAKPFVRALKKGELLAGILRKPGNAYMMDAPHPERERELGRLWQSRTLPPAPDPYRAARAGEPLPDEEPF